MSKYRDAMAANMMKHVKPLAPFQTPVVDLGGRKYHDWMAGILGCDFETWDMQAGVGVTRIVDAMRMEGISDASIGTIVSTSTFEHIAKPWAAAAHIARVMRPGGLLYVCAPFEFSYHKEPEDYWRYSPAALRVLFNGAFDEVACDWVTPLASYYLGRRKPTGGEADAMKVALAIHGLITEEELRFLYQQARTAKAGGEFVELGTFQGRSCSILCHVAALYGKIPWTIDDYSYMVASNERIVTKNLHAYGLAAHVIQGDSRKVSAGIDKVSCLFIDSKHLAEHFRAEAAAWLPKVVKGGVVICHDYQHTKWHEMKAVIDEIFGHGWTRLGVERSMIAFRKS